VDDLTKEDPVYAWEKTKELKAPTPAANNYFGYTVDVSDDFAVVGAYGNNSNQGAAYVYRKKSSGWVHDQTLTASDGAAGDYFGRAVAISGSFIVVGAPGFNGNEGAGYLYEYNGTDWVEPAALTDGHLELPLGVTPLFAGLAVDIEGGYACLGSPGEDTDDGAAYIFYRNQGASNSWDHQQRVSGDGFDERYGESVSISGYYLLVGAPEDNDTENLSGAAYYHIRSGGSWSLPEKIKADAPSANAYFGTSVSMYGTGALIGTRQEDTAYLFSISGGSWSQLDQLTSGDTVGGDGFSEKVSLSKDFLLIGAPFHDTSGFVDSGSAYLFGSGVNGSEILRIYADSPVGDDNLGQAVSIFFQKAIIGIPNEDTSQSNSGKVIIYEYLQQN
jgi:hypothetical protein